MELVRKMTAGDERYLSDESRVMGAAEYIAFPTNAEEIGDVIRWCAAHDVPLTAQGYAAVPETGETPVRGVFVAGDCRGKRVRQLATAVSDGANAALAACRYLDGEE